MVWGRSGVFMRGLGCSCVVWGRSGEFMRGLG